MCSSSHCIDASTLPLKLASSLLPSFLCTYSLSTSSLGCKALCMVISFLVLWSNFFKTKNGPEYLTRATARVYIPLIRFLLYSFVSSSFLVLLSYTFLILFFISTCLMVSAFNISKYLYVFFSPSVQISPWFGSSIPFVMCRFPLFTISMVHFSMPNSIPMSWLYTLPAGIGVSS